MVLQRQPTIGTVLLVEDSRGDAMVASAHVRAGLGQQTEVVVADTSDGAAALLAARSFDVVLLDLGLPDASGVELVERWVQSWPGLPIVVLTGREDDEVAKEALAAGAQDYLLKSELASSVLSRSLRHAVARAGSEQRYRALFAQSAGIVCIHDLDGRLQSINPAGAHALGYVPGEMEGFRLHDYVEPRHAWVVDRYLQAVRSDGHHAGRLVLLHRNGQRRYLDYTNHLYGRGRDAYVVGVGMDVTARVDLERQLREAVDALRAVTDASPLGLFRTDLHGEVVYVNPRMQQMVQVQARSGSEAWERAVHPDDRATVRAWWERVVADTQGRTHELELRWLRNDGHTVWTRATVLESRENEVRTGFVGTLADITDARVAQIALRRQETQAQTLADAVPIELMLLDMVGRVVWINDAGIDYCGRERSHIIGETVETLWSPARCAALLPLLPTVLAGTPRELDFEEPDALGAVRIRHARLLPEQGEDDPLPDGVHLVIEEVTQARRQHRRLQQLAERDALTGLLNRAGLIERLELALASSTSVTVLFLDLDGFKQVNDTHGHAAGDQVLRQCAQRLAGFARSSDAVGRLGGDEFVLVLPEVAEADAQRIVAELARTLEPPYASELGVALHVGASIGLATGTAPLDADALLRSADGQQYRNKRERRQRGPRDRE